MGASRGPVLDRDTLVLSMKTYTSKTIEIMLKKDYLFKTMLSHLKSLYAQIRNAYKPIDITLLETSPYSTQDHHHHKGIFTCILST